jgi:hypothetical protein
MVQLLPISIRLRDLEALRAVCRRRGWEFRAGQCRYRWFGRVLDDRPGPLGVGHCTHAIGVPGCVYEIGLVPCGDDLVPAWDDGPEDDLHRVMGPGGGLFTQAHVTETIRRAALRCGLHVGRLLDTENTLRLRVTTAAGGLVAHVRVSGTAATELWAFAPWEPHVLFLAEALGVVRRDEIIFLEADPAETPPVSTQF